MTDTDICTLVWPLLARENAALGTLGDVSDGWIIGWNPHGLSVVVAWFLPPEPFHNAVTNLNKIKKRLRDQNPPPGLPSYQALHILGYVRSRLPATDGIGAAHSPTADRGQDFFGSPISQLPSVLRESSVRQMRQSSDIWLDLVEGPMLGEVWCCGYRVQCCQLHVIRCEPNKWLTCKPTIFTATALYGPSGIRQLRNGKRPITVPGSLSTAEGILVPDVLQRECAPRISSSTAERLSLPQATAAKPAATTEASASSLIPTPDKTPAPDRDLAHQNYHQPSLHAAATGAPSAVSDVASSDLSRVSSFNESISDVAGPSLKHAGTSDLMTNQSQSFPYMSVFDIAKNVTPQRGLPPRLDFPTTNDDGELSYMLRMSQACLRVREVVESLVAPPEGGEAKLRWWARATESPPHPQHKRDMEHTLVDSFNSAPASPTRRRPPRRGPIDMTLDAVLYLLLLVLPIFSQLGRFLWTMEILEMRVRELINFVSLLRGRTRSCGLHPCIPHMVSSQRKARLFCYLNFASAILLDVLIGHFLRLKLLTGGPPLHQMAQNVTRRYLYENHMAYLDWFDGWPAGLKVNEDLNKTLCFFAKMVVAYWDALMRWPLNLATWSLPTSASSAATAASFSTGSLKLPPFPTLGDPSGPTEYLWIVPSYGLILALSLFGASFTCALVADLTGIVTLHLRILYHLVGFLYRGSKSLLQHFLLQFRGLKYNPLRKRTDTFEFATDQMLTSTLLFTTIVFLFPTIAVYYVYFAFIRVSVRLVQETLAMLAYFWLHLPLFPTVYWLRYRSTMKRGLVLSAPKVTMRRPLQAGGGAAASNGVAHTVDMTVLASPLPLHFMLTDFFVTLGVLVKPFLPKHAISLFLSGTADHGMGPMGELVPHLIADCVNPPCTLC